MEVQAQAKWVRTAPRKVKLVADALRGMPVAEALIYCKFIPKASARDVAKVIRSAQANAEHNFNLAKDDLVVKDIRVEEGPTLKRARPRAMGRYFSIFKRTSHITAVVEDRPGAVRRRPVAPPRAARPAPAPAAPPAAPAADAPPSGRGRAPKQASAAKAERETKTDTTEKPSATRAAKKADSDQPKKGKKK
ncbi:MAG TPA: 50S ribosomal protein L22 [Candidatus Limnocylindria bacterium]|nr:50S ribosomal protein L22 [Candidatus Limnocylindria bacterium]